MRKIVPICPNCNSPEVREIVYGYPLPETFEAAQRGEIEIGGASFLPGQVQALGGVARDVHTNGAFRQQRGYMSSFNILARLDWLRDHVQQERRRWRRRANSARLGKPTILHWMDSAQLGGKNGNYRLASSE
jgi:hypothetical protein